MDQLELPERHKWEFRRSWFEGIFDIESRIGGFFMSEHALGLLVELQATFCVGAFVGSVIISAAIIDAHLKEVEGGVGGMNETFAMSSFKSELEWLRKRRNRLVHIKGIGNPAISVGDHWSHRAEHEDEARRAIELVANVLFENPAI